MFQQTVVNKYLKSVDHEKMKKIWVAFQSHFHNPQTLENTHNGKEEQYKDNILIDLAKNWKMRLSLLVSPKLAFVTPKSPQPTTKSTYLVFHLYRLTGWEVKILSES